MNPATPVVEPAAGRSTHLQELLSQGRLARLIFVTLELALLTWLVRRFHLESQAFQSILYLVCGGFVVNHFLPTRARMPFFVALSLGSIAYVVGLRAGGQWDAWTSLTRTSEIVGLGLGLIGICHLPIPFKARIALLLAAGGALAACRGGWIEVPALGPIWPLLGALFMFRLIIYIHDLQHLKEPAKLSRSLAYFFLVPNICFPFFPVIDYKTFCRGYYSTEPFAIYQKGLSWMLKGIVQILLWRIVYYELYLDPSRVASGADLGRFIFTNVLLYLHVSGQFHLAIGMIHLFGFDLPATNRRYFLASSFTDYWRRVNIYWKDFIMKIFYYPLAFRLKPWGQNLSVVVASLCAFFVSWMLHSYQVFWLRQGFPVKLQDGLFWGSLAVLVVIGSLWELNRARTRAPAGKSRAWALVKLAACTGGTFLTMSFLWSVWSSDNLPQWAGLWQHADGGTLAWAGGAVAIVMAAAVVLEGLATPKGLKAAAAGTTPAFSYWRGCRDCLGPALLVFAVTRPEVTTRLPEETQVLARSLFQTTPNKSDEEYMVRGYYEDIMDASRSNSVLNESYLTEPADWVRLEGTDALRPTDDLRLKELVPAKLTLVNGVRIETDRWGLRDQEYEQTKSPGTYRIALLGSSLAMGWGVENGDVFESLIEARLNREQVKDGRTRYEILNFGVNGYSPIQNVATLELKVLPFKPDAVWILTHKEDPLFTMECLAKCVRRGIPLPDELAAIATKAGIHAKTPEGWAKRELVRYWPELFRWSYARTAAICRAEGIQPLWIFLPGVLEKGRADKDIDVILAAAEAAGFPRLALEAQKLYGPLEGRSSLTVAPWDAHPNKKGHELIAAGLYEVLMTTEPFRSK